MGIMRNILPCTLFRDERGTSVIELALIAPLLSLLTMGIVDLSNGFARRLELTEAADSTITKVSAGNFQLARDANGEHDFSEFREAAAAAAGVEEDAVTVDAWLECDGVVQDDFDGDCGERRVKEGCEEEIASPPPEAGCNPVRARYVRIHIDSSFRPMFATIVAPAADGTFPLSAEAAVRIQ
jgi:hypothetical protein